MRSRSSIVLLLVPSLALLAACSRSQKSQENMNESASSTPMKSNVETLVLNSMNASDITGNITLTRSADTLTVKISLEHLTPGNDYSAAIYHGTCEAEGQEAVALKSVLATEEGTGSSTTAVPMSALGETATEPTHEGLFVKVLHPDAEGAACINLPSEEESATTQMSAR